MNHIEKLIKDYLEYCEYHKNLDSKTIKAYSIDLKQFYACMQNLESDPITKISLNEYITQIHKLYKPKTVKRKIASVKSFFHYLEYEELIEINPFSKINVKFREPQILPKTIPFHTIQRFLSIMYEQRELAQNEYQKRVITRDIAVMELLFATGVRISELCSLKSSDVNLETSCLLIYGKGAKERIIQIGNIDVMGALIDYKKEFEGRIKACGYFFVNRLNQRLSEQSVRFMINKYTHVAAIDLHITPHMFRHPYVNPTLKYILIEKDFGYILPKSFF